jgi:hypothetical protein
LKQFESTDFADYKDYANQPKGNKESSEVIKLAIK